MYLVYVCLFFLEPSIQPNASVREKLGWNEFLKVLSLVQMWDLKKFLEALLFFSFENLNLSIKQHFTTLASVNEDGT